MAIIPRYLVGKAKRQNVLLDEAHALSMEHIAPGNLSEAVRFCVSYALARGAVSAAMSAHTESQRAAIVKMQQAAAANPLPGLPIEQVYAPRALAAPPAQATSLDALDALDSWPDDPAPAPSAQPAPILPTLADVLASTPDV